MADAYLDAGQHTDALITMLIWLPAVLSPVETFDATILERAALSRKIGRAQLPAGRRSNLETTCAHYTSSHNAQIKLAKELIRLPYSPQKRNVRFRLPQGG